jgi:hypothetical protein
MTSSIRLFELEEYRASRLDYVFQYLREHQAEIGPAMANAAALGLPISTVDEFRQVVLDGVTIGSLALYWRGFHRYRTNLSPTPSQEKIERACPGYKVRCHRDHAEDHVLRFLRDLRNAEIHPGAAFRYITCSRSADEILLQPILIRESPGNRTVFLFHDLSRKQQVAWVEKVESHWASFEWTTLGDFLMEEASTCIRNFDAQLDGKTFTMPKPLGYAKFDPAILTS